MAEKSAAARSFTADQVAAFRVARHCLTPGTRQPAVADLCRDTAGIQAQVMTQAEIALWTRGRHLTRGDIRSAIYERRDVVKTSAMRLTLHLHLIGARYYKKVWRRQGWISPVVLLGGRIVGTWFPKTSGQRSVLDVELFERQPRAVKDAIAGEATALGGFLGTSCEARIT